MSFYFADDEHGNGKLVYIGAQSTHEMNLDDAHVDQLRGVVEDYEAANEVDE